MKLTVIVITIIICIGIITWFIIRVPDDVTPKKFSNIPENSKWIGSVDEGFWFFIVSVDSTKKETRIQVYNDYNGNLAIDANYKLQSGCEVNPFTIENIRDNISYYGFHDIELKEQSCKLNLLKPVIGGEFSEIIE